MGQILLAIFDFERHVLFLVGFIWCLLFIDLIDPYMLELTLDASY